MPRSYLDPLAARLGLTPRKWDVQAWQGRCPAHRDRGRSLWMVQYQSGRAFLHCTRGCSEAKILEALALPKAALQRPTSRVVTTYTYRDAEGTPLFVVERYEPKRFVVRGGSRAQGVLYRLPELLSADPAAPVYVVEGEKDVDRLRALGLVATTSPYGCQAWRDEYATWLAGRRVIILPDNDPPGESYADTVARSLAGVAASVEIVRLPGLPHKGDVSDWLDRGHTKDGLLALTGVPGPTRPWRLGPLEVAVLRALQGGVIGRDALPGRVWGWPAQTRWNRAKGREVLTYLVFPRAEMLSKQAALSRALRTLKAKGLIWTRDGNVHLTRQGQALIRIEPLAEKLTQRGRDALGFPSPCPQKLTPKPDELPAGLSRQEVARLDEWARDIVESQARLACVSSLRCAEGRCASLGLIEVAGRRYCQRHARGG